MGLAWQQGPLAAGSVGHFLTAQPLPDRLLFVEPLRRRMRARQGDEWIADSEDVLLLHEPGRYPVAYFPIDDIRDGVLVAEDRVTQHGDLGEMQWYTVVAGGRDVPHGAWQHTALPAYATDLTRRVAFGWRAVDAFYEEDDRIVGHAADPYHRVDIRATSRHLVVRDGDRVIADTHRPVVLYESGFAPRWYVDRDDIDESALEPVEGQTFCPYKGLADYYTIGEHKKAAWSYVNAWPEAGRVSNLVSFEPDKIEVWLDDRRLHLEPGQTVVAHGIDRGLDPDELLQNTARSASMNAALEVVILPVSDPDKSLDFYRDKLGFALDVDYAPTKDFRVVQLTPEGSSTSIQFGVGLTDAPPGSVQGLYLVVTDIAAVRDELVDRGVGVSSIRHKDVESGQWQGVSISAPIRSRADYSSFADFTDPDGNAWIIQERGHPNA